MLLHHLMLVTVRAMDSDDSLAYVRSTAVAVMLTTDAKGAGQFVLEIEKSV